MSHQIQEAVVKVNNLHKGFKLPQEKKSSVKSVFVDMFQKRSYVKQEVLKGITFEVKKGEFFGIVGRNGSGKSTLLKLLAHIYTPTSGSMHVKGSLVPFIELGVGFNPELTGRENVYLNGALLGFSRKEIDGMYKDIVDFAELKEFMDQKLKNYSSGMQVRLAFSIAIRAQGDILLLDEVLAVGDSAFQQKCYDYFNQLKKEKKTIILVSHNMQAVEQFCDRALLIDKGRIVKIGLSSEIGAMYENMFIKEELLASKSSRPKDVTLPTYVHSIKIYQFGKRTGEIQGGEDFEIELDVRSDTNMTNVNVGINIKNHSNNMLLWADTKTVMEEINLHKNKPNKIRFKMTNILTNGVYSINSGIAHYEDSNPKVIYRQEVPEKFTIINQPSKSLTTAPFEATVVR